MNTPPIEKFFGFDPSESVEERIRKLELRRTMAEMMIDAMLESADDSRNLDLLIMREHGAFSKAIEKHMQTLVLCENNDSEAHNQKKKEFLALFERIVEEVKNFDSTICLTSADAENS